VVYHLLRWHLFLTDPEWQSAMFTALRWLREEFAALDCVLANDCHPASTAVTYHGMGFQQALEFAERESYGEVSSFAELYIELGSESEIALKPAKGGLSRCVQWPRDKPLPPGWSRPAVWDSKGYWRFA